MEEKLYKCLEWLSLNKTTTLVALAALLVVIGCVHAIITKLPMSFAHATLLVAVLLLNYVVFSLTKRG